MARLIIQNARLLTMQSDEPDNPCGLIPSADVWINSGKIERIDPRAEGDPPVEPRPFTEIMDVAGKVVMPGFVDCHTHTCWAGDRLDEWQRRLAGATYLEIMEQGGGIMSTVRAVRAATEQELTNSLLSRLDKMLRHGTTTVEVKSGYGLTTADELKMLRAVQAAQSQWPGTVVPTACLGHALDPDIDAEEFVRTTIEETLPAVHDEFPGIAIDGYCEQGAWSLPQTLALTEAAAELGHPIRMHADQFHSLGLIPAAIEREFVSVDHLEASTTDELTALAQSNTAGVMLPACGLFVDGRYADGRAFLDAGGKLAIATNYNPGSAPCYSMPLVIALACNKLGLTVTESLAAATTGGAEVLSVNAGRIAPGSPADLIVLKTADERELGFELGGNPVASVICRGSIW